MQALTLHAIKDIRALHAVENWGIEILPGDVTQLVNPEVMCSADADLGNSGEPHSVTTRPVWSSDSFLEGIMPNYKTQNTVFVNGPPAPYVILTVSWRDSKQQEVGSYHSYYDIKGRPDKHLWVEVCDKVSWEDVYLGHKNIDCCISFKIKKDRDGNILEHRARCNANGWQQEVASHSDKFAPTSKFSCSESMCFITAGTLISAIAGNLHIYKPKMKINKIAGEYQPVDIFTKGLPQMAFQCHCRTIMGK